MRSMLSRIRCGVALALLATVLSSCTRTRLGLKYFLTACAADGPVQNTDFEIKLPPFDLDDYYAELDALRGAYEFQRIETVRYQDRNYPVYWIRLRNSADARRLLIVAGVHGDERAALLSIPRLLQRLARAGEAQRSWDVSVIVPVNPVGAAHASRYNGSGCDINRDFGSFATAEARAVRRVLDEYAPDLVVAPHEGPQEGFFLVATSAADPTLARRMVSAVDAVGIPLAQRSFLNLALGTPGLSTEGWWTSLGKRLIRLGSLGTYLDSRDLATYTTESSWGSADFGARIDVHVIAIEAILESTATTSIADRVGEPVH